MRVGVRRLDVPLPDEILNPDIIARAFNPQSPERAEMTAGREALRRRAELLNGRRNFAIETTLSGNGEMRFLRDARALDYYIVLVYISTGDVDLDLRRIEQRQKEQNRNVPKSTVTRRFVRTLAQAGEAADISDLAYVYDNSGLDFQRLLVIEHGRVSVGGDAAEDSDDSFATRAPRNPRQLPLWIIRSFQRQLASIGS